MPRVALWLPTSIKGSRDLLRGVLSYVNLNGYWSVDLIDEFNPRLAANAPEKLGYSGLIVDMRDRRQEEILRASDCPVVLTCVPDALLDSGPPFDRLCRIECDNEGVGLRAAEFFLERKFKNYAFAGDVTDAHWSVRRRIAFCRKLAETGCACDVYPLPSESERGDFAKEKHRLSAWLKALPKPSALLAANDTRGRQVLMACQSAGVQVPQEVAVLGVDNDDVVCEATQPPLSSIQMSVEQAGFEAARVLDRMIRRNTRRGTRQTVITFGFLRVEQRRSTDILQVADPLVARAIDVIRLNADATITVEDIVQHLRVSRRWLEKCFRSEGRTVRAEIMLVRMNRVQTLLRETKLTVEAIAEDCGFTSTSHLGTVFRKHFGTTPAAYRRNVRGI